MQRFHVCSHLRRPLTNPRRGLAFGVLLTVLLFMCKPLAAQQQVTGRVVSAINGEPLQGVTVTVQHTNIRALTDDGGLYRIAAASDAVLVFTSIGYETAEEAVRSRREVNAFLEPAESALQEVEVNAGYYTVKDRERTGSISRITAKEIAKQPIRNPMEAMIGRMPGVFIEQGTGVPGGGFRIQIRGRNSISSGNRPLYIVDGVPFPAESVNNSMGTTILMGATAERGSPLDGINPSDIESIEVLKDADATAIYGSRGANGVVLITTKKGRIGKPRLQAGFSTGFGEVANRLELLNTEQWLAMREQAFWNDGLEPTAANAPDLLEWDRSRYTDWQDVLIGGTARSNRLHASISGGGSGTSFLLSGNYMDEGSVYPSADKYRKYGALFNMHHTSADNRLEIGFSFNAVGSANTLPTTDFTGSAIDMSPMAPPVYKEDGSLSWEHYNAMANPLAIAATSYRADNTNLNTQLQLGYRLMEGLRIKLAVGYNRLVLDEITKWPARMYNPGFGITTSEAFYGRGHNGTLTVEPQVFYDRQFPQGELNVLFGGSYQQTRHHQESFVGTGFTNEGMLDNMSFAPDLRVADVSGSQYRYAAAFARVNYRHNGRYIVNLTARRDGSSRFGPDKRFANFGAVGAAWLFSEEQPIKEHLPFLSFGKLRGSYGVTGNDQIADYGYMHTYSPTDRPFLGAIGMLPDRHANPDYSWETNHKLEAALELGLFRDRIGLEIGVYRNRSSSQLLGYPLSAVTGMQSVQQNLAATVQNSGWEFLLRTVNVQRGRFRWETHFNISLPRNKLIAYPGLESSSHRNTLEIGRSLNLSRRYILLGVDPETGTYAFEQDANGTLVRRLFDTDSRYYGGLQNDFQYGRLSLSVFLQFTDKRGEGLFASFPAPPGSLYSNQPVQVMEGEGTLVQRYTRGSSAEYRRFGESDRTLVDASFIRLKNVALSYSLPASVVRRLGAGNITFSVTGQNLLTWTGYDGLDPETANSRVLPPLRTITFGARVQF
ncbi:SusC/RagA family TonB-linked outer membrane protein [Parapedobacter lycopersici]|uniref:SusC/RagA family TonB-linked outer membrane protein n=1 Tax=Parapedobacter lycopersici TaxID=1864939 RepID=UPI00214D223C|nr:SusC/RagA family TonB-linked outer membrane protein [Parapedobacter lycopersici]